MAELLPQASLTGRAMNAVDPVWALLAFLLVLAACGAGAEDQAVPRDAPWVKYERNPVLGGQLGTCFDVAVLKEGKTFRMWFSWRPKNSLALVESEDGIHWHGPDQPPGAEPVRPLVVLPGDRPGLLKRGDTYHLWYATGQIRYATSRDGKVWKPMSDQPVLKPELPWEKRHVMCPHVIWDAPTRRFRMWYSGGEGYEPDAIGYATSPDGIAWTKHPQNPVFRPDRSQDWEKDRVTACQVVVQEGWHYMFYIGFRDVNTAQIGLARSKDGITGWQRHPANPIIRARKGDWDGDACYKPFAVLDGNRWMLWYNGRRGDLEQIGLATREGARLADGFEP